VQMTKNESIGKAGMLMSWLGLFLRRQHDVLKGGGGAIECEANDDQVIIVNKEAIVLMKAFLKAEPTVAKPSDMSIRQPAGEDLLRLFERLAKLYERKGMLHECELTYQDSLAHAKRIFGEKDAATLHVLVNYGHFVFFVSEKPNKKQEAIQCLDAALHGAMELEQLDAELMAKVLLDVVKLYTQNAKELDFDLLKPYVEPCTRIFNRIVAHKKVARKDYGPMAVLCKSLAELLLLTDYYYIPIVLLENAVWFLNAVGDRNCAQLIQACVELMDVAHRKLMASEKTY
jgi:hypothetical protein